MLELVSQNRLPIFVMTDDEAAADSLVFIFKTDSATDVQ